MDTKTILNEATGRMQKAIDHLEEELLNVRAGKASPNALNGVMVDYFGSQVPVSGAASVTVPDARTILIQPWDKNMLRPIEKAIIDSNIGLTPSNNGEQIRLTIPHQPAQRPPRRGGSLQEGPEGGHARGRIEGRRNAVAETARKVLQDAGRSAFEEGEGDYDGLTCRLPQDEKPGWKFIPAGLFPSVCPANPAHTGAATPHRPGKTDSDRRRRIASDRKPVRTHPPPIRRTVPVPQHKKSRSPTAETGIHLFAAAQAAENYFTFGPAVTSFLPSSLPVNFTKFFTKRLARSSALTSQSLALL